MSSSSTLIALPEPNNNHRLVKVAMARALWHSGPGFGMSGNGMKEAFQRDRPEMDQMAERVMMHLERQGISLISMDE